jgi:hypothetical protein
VGVDVDEPRRCTRGRSFRHPTFMILLHMTNRGVMTSRADLVPTLTDAEFDRDEMASFC